MRRGDTRATIVAVTDLVVRKARLAGDGRLVDVAIAGGRITAVSSRVEGDAAVEVDADGRLMLPAFVEPHIHLDKVEALPLLPPNRSGTLREAIELMAGYKRAVTVDEITARAGRVIRRAVLSGTTVLRTHVDVDPDVGLKALQGVLRARAEHDDLCDIQIVAFPQMGIERAPEARSLMAAAMEHGADLVGGMPHWEVDHDAARRHIEFCLELAERHDADVDMHVDETDDGGWHTLELLIEATERHGWGGRVTAGHCCAMAAWSDEFAASVIRRAAAVGVNVITNPATNLVIQGREDTEPRRRGIPRVKELLAAGVTLAAGQDNVHDGFYPFGSGDQLLLALMLVHAAQLTLPEEVEAALGMIGERAASILGLDDYGLRPGGRADLVVLDAETPLDALRFVAPRRWVIRGGRVVAETRREQDLARSGRTAARA